MVASADHGYDREARTLEGLLRRWLDGPFLLITSDHLNAESERTLINPYFAQRVKPEIRFGIQGALQERATVVVIAAAAHAAVSHPDDDLVLATAVATSADYLVTGNRQLRRLVPTRK